jgi:lambda repressor-like predicted transcriptional regulator
LYDSDEKVICDILQEADFLSTAQYQGLIQRISKLKVADPKVEKAAILEVPFQEFNPHEYVGQPVASVKELRGEVDMLLGEWENTLKDILDDPIVKKKIELLDVPTAKMLNDFKAGIIAIDKQNALKIRNAITSLQKGLEKVELSTESLKTTLNKPLTPAEAIEAFKAYIDEVSKGKDWEKIRIVLK